MDPVTTALVAAVLSGATSAVLAKPIQDAYEKLKGLILSRFGASGLPTAIKDLEGEPESDGRQLVLKEKVAKAGADRDPAILQAAQELLGLLNASPAGAQLVQTAIGKFIAIAGQGSQASVNVNQPPKRDK